MKTQLLESAFLTDDMPATSNAVAVLPHGIASITLTVWQIQREEEFGNINVFVQGSEDAENWVELESLEFSGEPTETLVLRNVLTASFTRIRVFLQNGAIASVLGAEMNFASVGAGAE